jgi:hypothetical protein
MADASLIEGLAKKFLNMVPRQFYREAAQKLVHEICETIYKDLDEKDRFPRVEIIDIVKGFVEKHLGNPPENPNENPMGIRDAISDSLKKTTLEVYKDDLVNKLLLKNILLDEFEGGKVTKTGIFYKSLEQSILTAKDPYLKNRLGKKIGEAVTVINEGASAIGSAASNAASKMLPKIDKQKVFAKNVLAALPNVDIKDTPDPDARVSGADVSGAAVSGAPDVSTDTTSVSTDTINDATTSVSTDTINDATTSVSSNDALTAPTTDSALVPAPDPNAPNADKTDNNFQGGAGMMDGLTKMGLGDDPNWIKNGIGMVGTGLMAASAMGALKGSNGSGNGGNSTTNIGYEPNKNGVLPYIQTNCNGSGLGLGLPNIDLNFLSKFLDGLKEPIAEELIKKIQERLPESTIDSITVKRNIYDKILQVIQAHLQSQQGKDMLLGQIKTIVEPEIKFLTQDNEVKKRLIKVIFKNKSSEIYKKLIDIIAKNTTESKPPEKTKNDKNCKCDDKSAKKTDVTKNESVENKESDREKPIEDISKEQRNQNEAEYENMINATLRGGADGEKTDASAQKTDASSQDNTDPKKNENNANFTTDITKVIIEFSKEINVDINTFDGFPEVKKSIQDTAIAQFKIALDEQQKNMEKDAKNNEENSKKANEEGIKNIALGLVNTKIDEIKDKEQQEKARIEKNTRYVVLKQDDRNEVRQASQVSQVSPSENGGNLDADYNKETVDKQLNDVDKVYENFNKKSIENEDTLKKELELKQEDTSKKTREKLIKRSINNRAIEKVNEQIENKKSILPPPPPTGGNPTKNKTKRRRTKNNTRKMKQKRRTIKKT